MTPGVGELVDDALHFVRTGHTEHSDVHFDGHADTHQTNEEHGCSAAFHLCSCHQSPLFVAAPVVPELQAAAAVAVHPAWLLTDLPEGVREGLARPPRA